MLTCDFHSSICCRIIILATIKAYMRVRSSSANPTEDVRRVSAPLDVPITASGKVVLTGIGE